MCIECVFHSLGIGGVHYKQLSGAGHHPCASVTPHTVNYSGLSMPESLVLGPCVTTTPVITPHIHHEGLSSATWMTTVIPPPPPPPQAAHGRHTYLRELGVSPGVGLPLTRHHPRRQRPASSCLVDAGSTHKYPHRYTSRPCHVPTSPLDPRPPLDTRPLSTRPLDTRPLSSPHSPGLSRPGVRTDERHLLKEYTTPRRLTWSGFLCCQGAGQDDDDEEALTDCGTILTEHSRLEKDSGVGRTDDSTRCDESSEQVSGI